MRLIVDNREPKEIITILQSRIENLSLENLELGDYVIQNNNNEPVMIFERKSLSDLIASIKDGRYNEQSLRLSECEVNNRNIYYIIEGNIMNFCNRQNETNQKMLFSSMLSISSKKGFSLLKTNGFIETAEFIIYFFQKIMKDKSIKPFYNNINISQSYLIGDRESDMLAAKNAGIKKYYLISDNTNREYETYNSLWDLAQEISRTEKIVTDKE